MKVSKGTIEHQLFLNVLNKEGPLSIIDLARLARENHMFRGSSLEAVEQKVKRFTGHYEALGLMTRENGKLVWLPTRNPPKKQDTPTRENPSIMTVDGFLTLRGGVRCDHCGQTIDLTKAELKWRPKSRYLALALHIHHFFRVTCDRCGWVGRYDTRKDVRPILQ